MSILAHAPKWDQLRSKSALNGALANRDALMKGVKTIAEWDFESYSLADVDYSGIEARLMAQFGLGGYQRNYQLEAYAAGFYGTTQVISFPRSGGKTLRSYAALLGKTTTARAPTPPVVIDFETFSGLRPDRRFWVIDQGSFVKGLDRPGKPG